jgi:hypothetical protein
MRSGTPIACDVSGLPRRFVRPQVRDFLRSCSFVYRPKDGREVIKFFAQITGWILRRLQADRPHLHAATTLFQRVERPRPWPQAWQTKRPFRVVAHATALLLAPAPAVAPPGGRQGTPPDDNDRNQCDDLLLRSTLTARECRSLLGRIVQRSAVRGEHLARGPSSPLCSPSRSPD